MHQHRLKCAQINEASTNGNAVAVSGGSDPETTNNQLVSKINNLTECQSQLHGAIKRIQYFQIATFILIIILGILLSYIIHLERKESFTGSCTAP